MIWHSLQAAFDMFWQTLWALVVGFTLSGLVQAFVSRERMQRTMGGHDPGSIARASFFGAVSSSCSYAAAALAKTLFARGADFTTSMVFMFASTNLVVELGIVLWLLMGWQFAAAEIVGGLIMIALLSISAPRVFRNSELEEVRATLDRATADEHGTHDHSGHDHSAHGAPSDGVEHAKPTLADAVRYTLADLRMLRKELVIGYLVAGIIEAAVPQRVFTDLFAPGHGWLTDVWHVILGPFIAVISFVCSVGNVPLANALYGNGLSFGGAIAFVFADLITLPLLLIYAKIYGRRITLKLLALFWAVMSVAGLAVDHLFRAIGITRPAPNTKMTEVNVTWDHTTILNIISVVGFIVLLVIAARQRKQDAGSALASPFATDPTCGMQVTKSQPGAVATVEHDGHPETFYFCCDGCKVKFLASHASK